jgi:hypothetical protein
MIRLFGLIRSPTIRRKFKSIVIFPPDFLRKLVIRKFDSMPVKLFVRQAKSPVLSGRNRPS